MNKTLLSMFLTAVTLACAGTADATGTLDPAAIRAAVATAQPAVSRCYDATLAQHRDASGRVVVRFTIDASGNVRGATASGMEQYPGLGACVASAVSATRFPAPTGGEVSVSYPFSFRPQ